ncbi:MAG: tetratricopeptide repeat protein [Terrimicrobiaceae bacterium]|nr:tetratricopeptide repeat protein [Terrimicrobiaceae bacterium]
MKHLPIFLAAALLALAAVQAETPVDDNTRFEVEGILKLFERKKYDEVIQKIRALPLEGEVGAFLLNLQGAAYTKLKDYEAAKASFEAALKKAPGMFSATYNLGEILFLQRKYAEALAWFQGMLANDPRNELLQFKVFLSQLLSEDTEGARKTLSRMKFPGDTPAWYYASAAWELRRGNRGKASDYLDGARYIFPGKTEIYEETFTDLGWPTK